MEQIMKDSIIKKAEIASNISIVVVALIVTLVLVKKSFFNGSQPSDSSPAPVAGTALSFPGVDWNSHRKNLLLVMSTQCRFCSESAPFYRRLADEATRNKDARLIAFLPQEVAEGRKYLSEMNVPVAEVFRLTPDSIATRGFPTLVLVDGKGVVKETWVGQLTPNQESDVLNRLKCEDCGGD
jgi:hypothetical protein